MSVAIALDGSRSELREIPETLSFIEPPPGMASLTQFDVVALDDAGFLFALRSTEQPGVRLFAIPPRAYFPNYAPETTKDVRQALGMADDAQPVLLAIVHPGQGEATTANLLAPIVIDPSTGVAAQVVLDSDEWPLRAPMGVDAD